MCVPDVNYLRVVEQGFLVVLYKFAQNTQNISSSYDVG